MSNIIELMSIDYLSLILAVITVLAGSVAIKELIEKFCKMVGIEFSWIREKRERAECENYIKTEMQTVVERQDTLEAMLTKSMEERKTYNMQLNDAIALLKNDLQALSDRIQQQEIKKRYRKLRFDILNFANELPSKTEVSGELISSICQEINEYEELATKYNLKNNQVNASVAVILKRYEDMLMNGSIINDEE